MFLAAARDRLDRLVWRRDERRPRAWLVPLGLLLAYEHSVFFTSFYVPEERYFLPFANAMTWGERLLSLGLGLCTNLGLIAAPFLRAPGRPARMVLGASLVVGAGITLCLNVTIAWDLSNIVVFSFEQGHYKSLPTLIIDFLGVVFVLIAIGSVLVSVTLIANVYRQSTSQEGRELSGHR